MDCKIVELKTITGRDHQLFEKDLAKMEEAEHDRVFDQLWYEGYLAKIEREEREKELRAERREEQKGILGYQLDMKAKRLAMDKEEKEAEVTELKALWKQQEQEEKDAVV